MLINFLVSSQSKLPQLRRSNSIMSSNEPFDKSSVIIVGFGLPLKLIELNPINFNIAGCSILEIILISRSRLLTVSSSHCVKYVCDILAA